MPGLYDVEVEPEVDTWLDGLSDRDFGRVDFVVGVLAEQAETLGEPHSRHLGGKVRELRFYLLRQQTRVTYWLAPGRRVVLLTVFHKTRSAETAEVQRAIRAQQVCEATHVTRPMCITAQENVMSKHQHSGNDSGHDSYEQVAAARRSRAEYREGCEEARRAFLIGRVLRERRLALGLSQTEVAARAGMTQPALSRLEAGGVVPTIPVLERIALALDTELVVTLAAPAA